MVTAAPDLLPEDPTVLQDATPMNLGGRVATVTSHRLRNPTAESLDMILGKTGFLQHCLSSIWNIWAEVEKPSEKQNKITRQQLDNYEVSVAACFKAYSDMTI